MTEQGSEAMNPGQAIYDALSDEAKAAVDALPNDVLASAVGRMAASIMAAGILSAHKAAPYCWSVICDGATDGRRLVCLNVANTNLISLDEQVLKVVVDGAIEEVPELLGTFDQMETDASYRSPTLKQFVVPTEQVAISDRVSGLLTANDLTIRAFASLGWRRNQRWKWHRDDW